MWRPDHELLAEQLTHHFGIELEGRALPARGGYPSFELLPVDGHPSEAFRLIAATKWRSLELRFVPGAYAGDLIAQMGSPPPGRTETFVRLAEHCIAERAQLSLEVNGVPQPPTDSSAWPEKWRRAQIGLTKSPAIVNTEDAEANNAELLRWTRRFAGMVFALLPLEEQEPAAEPDRHGLPEGAVIRIEVNRYERSRINRAACIELHGASCKACGFNFGEAYGPIGDGFIHVHHIVPVSQIGTGYVIDPFTDLVPLCANCHAIAHKQNPPLRVEEISALLLDR